MKSLEKQVQEAIEDGTLSEPFNAAMIKAACPGWEDRTYHLFLVDYVVGVGCKTELLERVSFDMFRLNRPTGEASAMTDEAPADSVAH